MRERERMRERKIDREREGEKDRERAGKRERERERVCLNTFSWRFSVKYLRPPSPLKR